MSEKELFKAVTDYFSKRYPSRRIEIKKDYGYDTVFIDGKARINIEGWPLLFILKRLCDELADELR